jgi:hypothetical protein
MHSEQHIILTDAEGDQFTDETYDDPVAAIQARDRLAADHDGDVGVELVDEGLPNTETTDAEPIIVSDEEVLGDLPDDNPFAEVVETLRSKNVAWGVILSAMDDAYDSVEQSGAHRESYVTIPEYKIQAIIPDEKSTSGESYMTIKHAEPTKEEAVEWAENRPEVLRIEHVERIGEVTVG